MAEETFYSALHWAKKAEASAKLAAENAQSGGALLQLGFDGSLVNGVLEFKHAPGGVEVSYTLVNNTEYELDLAFSNTATLPADTEIVVKNGADTIRFVSALHRDATTNATVADMDAVMRYNSSTGYRWLFKAAYKVTPSGAKVFLLYPVVAGGVVTLTGDQTIDGLKTFSDIIRRSFAFGSSGKSVVEARDSNNKGSINYTAYYAGNGVYNRVQSNNTTSGKNAYMDIVTKDDGTGVVQFNGTSTISANLTNLSSVQVPTPAAEDNSTKIATTAWVNTRLGGTNITSTELGYLDGVTSAIQTQLNGTVKTTGNQTVGGVKTFTSEVVSQKTGGCYYLKNANYDYTTNPSANQSQYIVWRDKNNKDLSYVSQVIDTAGTANIGIYASTYKTDGTRVTGTIAAYAKKDGSVYTYAPTPGATDNSTKIATTAWVNNRGISLKYASGVAVTVADGGTYTAPSRGVVILFLDTKENDLWSYVYCNGYKVGMAHGKSSRSNGDGTVFIPVAAGDKITRDSNFNVVEGHFYPNGV